MHGVSDVVGGMHTQLGRLSNSVVMASCCIGISCAAAAQLGMVNCTAAFAGHCTVKTPVVCRVTWHSRSVLFLFMSGMLKLEKAVDLLHDSLLACLDACTHIGSWVVRLAT